jgi:hypothetical protein
MNHSEALNKVQYSGNNTSIQTAANPKAYRYKLFTAPNNDIHATLQENLEVATAANNKAHMIKPWWSSQELQNSKKKETLKRSKRIDYKGYDSDFVQNAGKICYATDKKYTKGGSFGGDRLIKVDCNKINEKKGFCFIL